jgi:hypothetical protein
VYNWHFSFLGANQDAFAEAGRMGIHAAGVANYQVDKVGVAYWATSKLVARMWKQMADGETVKNDFSDEERNQMR